MTGVCISAVEKCIGSPSTVDNSQCIPKLDVVVVINLPLFRLLHIQRHPVSLSILSFNITGRFSWISVQLVDQSNRT